jgi:hypothetical protein
MTPWFAAATGFVIAASLWIYSPQAQLTYPAIAIGKMPCDSSGCGQHVEQQGAGSLAMNSGEPLQQEHKSATHAGTRARRQARTAASGLTFGYATSPVAHGHFALVVRVTGKRVIKNWSLTFLLPGDHIEFVYGANWRAVGSDGLAAGPFTGDHVQQPGGFGGDGAGLGAQGGEQRDYGHGGTPDQSGVVFTVIASGTPVAPAYCSFDGASCTFHNLTTSRRGRR